MDHPRTDLREPNLAGAGAFGIPAEGQLPVAASAPTARVAGVTKSHRSWWRIGARVVRNALVAVAVMTLVPIAIVAVEGDYLARMLYQQNMNLNARFTMVQPVRAFVLPKDPSITPAQAGATLNELQYTPLGAPGFVLIEPATKVVLPWHSVALAPDLFPTARPNMYPGPSSRSILEAAAKGFNARELDYLRMLATAPVWRDFDLIARAPTMDVIGGQLRTPFGPQAQPEMRPLPSYRGSRELAQAGVARAAYYMAAGQPQEAERTLRSIVSFGFTMIDNATSTMDELIGEVIVGIGRDALQRYYVLEHDPRATLPALQGPVRMAGPSAFQRHVRAQTPADEARRRLLQQIVDPAVPRGERFEGVQQLSVSSCTNVRELMFGPRADVAEALARAKQSLARYPSEQALVDLYARGPSAVGTQPWHGLFQALAVSSASVSGTVLHNPRLAACTRVLTFNW